jgi:hypothetical protein
VVRGRDGGGIFTGGQNGSTSRTWMLRVSTIASAAWAVAPCCSCAPPFALVWCQMQFLKVCDALLLHKQACAWDDRHCLQVMHFQCVPIAVHTHLQT